MMQLQSSFMKGGKIYEEYKPENETQNTRFIGGKRYGCKKSRSNSKDQK